MDNSVSKLSYILKKFDINNSSKIAFDTCYNGYNELYKRLLYNKNVYNNIQIGGGKYKHIYNNIKFKFKHIEDDEMHYIKMYTKKEPECVIILISKGDNEGVIQSITNNKDCIRGKNDVTKIGSLLLKSSLDFIKKYRDNFKIKKLTLTDNAYKKCGKTTINLGLMLTLITGTTWYGKYGFKPENKELFKQFKKNKKIMSEIKLKDCYFLRNLIINEFNKIKPDKLHIENIMSVYNKSLEKDMLLKDFIKIFLVKYDKMCNLFSKFYVRLSQIIGLRDFRNETFYLDL